MNSSHFLTTRRISWADPPDGEHSRCKSEPRRSDTPKHRMVRLMFVHKDDSGLSPYSKKREKKPLLIPEAHEIRPVDRQVIFQNADAAKCCDKTSQNIIKRTNYQSKDIQVATKDVAQAIKLTPQKLSQFKLEGNIVTSHNTDHVEPCLFCRMESDVGFDHKSWCRKLANMGEMYSQYTALVNSRVRQRRAQSGGLVANSSGATKENFTEIRNILHNGMRTAQSPSSPPPPPTSVMGLRSPIAENVLRSPDFQQADSSRYGDVRVKLQQKSVHLDCIPKTPSFLPEIGDSTEKNFRPPPVMKYREITVSPAVGVEFVVAKLGLKFRIPASKQSWPNPKSAPRSTSRQLMSRSNAQTTRTLSRRRNIPNCSFPPI